MPVIKIFSESEIRAFENPPVFIGEERKKYFRLNKTLEKVLKTLRSPQTQIGFLLHYGYFKKSNRFFNAQSFYQQDIEYVKSLLGISGQVDMGTYDRKVFSKHKKVILSISGVMPFSLKKRDFNRLVESLVKHRDQPRDIIQYMQYWCKIKNIEMCGYSYISVLITDTINDFEKRICRQLEANLTDRDKKLLDSILGDPVIENVYPLTKLKRFIQEDKPTKIRETLIEFLKIKDYFFRLGPLIESLQLPNGTFKYYGTWLVKAKKSQVLQLQNPYIRYLHLLSFIHYQFYLWQDAYTFILLTTLQTYTRRPKKLYDAAQENPLSDNGEDQKEVGMSGDATVAEGGLWTRTFHIIRDISLSANDKILHIERLADQYERTLSSHEDLSKKGQVEQKGPRPTYFDFLSGFTRKISTRVSNIVKVLTFDEQNSESDLISAIRAYQKYDQIVKPEVYTVLFNEQEKAALYDRKGSFKMGLCKTLFFSKVANGIKSGMLNLRYSYKYQAVNEYLIGKERWEREKEVLIDRAGLSGFSDPQKVLASLKERLHRQYLLNHQNFIRGNNPYLSFNKEMRPKVKTPATSSKDNKRISVLFDDCKYLLIPQILTDIERATGFLNCFQHMNIKHKRKKPELNVFLAALIGYGCNLGMGKMGQISRGVEAHAIANTVNWYFHLDNVLNANDRIVDMIDRLAISDLFRKNPHLKYSSSDGQKYKVAVPSLQATFSVKYYGMGKGVSVYSFINDKFALFYNTVFSSSEREAAYVLDGLLHNEADPLENMQGEDFKIDWKHTTDTHGFTENVFGVTHLLGVSFAPRIRNFENQRIYGFEKPSYYKQKGYFWLPKRSIDTGLIEQQWEDILRLAVTIRLKEVPASTIFRRLSSYARQNPLYKALKEFGRIIKTIFLLQYINNVELRQQIEYQLNMVELSNKFAKAVFFGRSGEFHESTEEEQRVVAACRVLIQNAVVLWNYLYISKKIVNAQNNQEINRVFDILRDGSMITWRHVHLEGTYNFDENFASNFSPSQMANILDMNSQHFMKLTA